MCTPAHGDQAVTIATAKPQPAKPRFDPDQQDVRRELLRRAQHSNRLEGAEPNPAYAYIDEAFIRGDVDADGAATMLRAHHNILDWDDIKRRLAAGEKVAGY
jgi:menaquinone-dependent protoporphyrinogen IX oxidase